MTETSAQLIAKAQMGHAEVLLTTRLKTQEGMEGGRGGFNLLTPKDQVMLPYCLATYLVMVCRDRSNIYF